jgi:hypothetical protein
MVCPAFQGIWMVALLAYPQTQIGLSHGAFFDHVFICADIDE